MAGVKGRSGGPRPNSGGRRPGAGRKPKCAETSPAAVRDGKGDAPPSMDIPSGKGDAKGFLERVVRGDLIPNPAQLEAAKALLPYQHKKLGETGKKEQRQEDAGKVAGRFAPSAPPRLATVGGKKV